MTLKDCDESLAWGFANKAASSTSFLKRSSESVSGETVHRLIVASLLVLIHLLVASFGFSLFLWGKVRELAKSTIGPK